MKLNDLQFIKILLFLVLLYNNNTVAQEGCYFNVTQDSVNPLRSINSYNGYWIQPQGDYRMLVIYVEGEEGGTTISTTNWPSNQVPMWSNNWLSLNPINQPQELFSKAFYENSLGKIRFAGDYLINPTVPNKTIKIPANTDWQFGVLNAVFSHINNNSEYYTFLTNSGFNNINQFDQWDIKNKSKYEQCSNSANNYIDHVMIIVKNITGGCNNCGYTNKTNSTLLGMGVEYFSVFRADDLPPLAIAQHEISHGFIGDNRWHTSGDGYQKDYWTVHGGGGSGVLGLFGSSFQTASAFDRYRLGWCLNGRNPQQIYARNAGNTADVNGELDCFNGTQQGDYVLRDFLTTGDAIRIKLPYMDNGEAPQYLWLENHQTNYNNGGIMDD